MKETFLSAAILTASAVGVQAAVISPTTVDDTGANSFANAAFVATNLITGTHAALLADAPGGSGNWVSNASGGDYYAPTVGPDPVFVFDMGSDTDLAKVYFWAYSNGTGSSTNPIQNNSAKDFNLRFATAAEGTGGFATSITINPSFSAGPSANTTSLPGPQPVQEFSFSSIVNARYVELTVTDNHYGLAGGQGGDRVGIAEIAFDTIPEPGSFALFGLAGFGLLLRRRR